MSATLLKLLSVNRTVDNLLLERQDIFFRLTCQPFRLDRMESKMKPISYPFHVIVERSGLAPLYRYVRSIRRPACHKSFFRVHNIYFITYSRPEAIPESERTWSIRKMDQEGLFSEPDACDWEVTPPEPM